VTSYRLVTEPAADLDVESAFVWYQHERSGLGLEFLDELRRTYERIITSPFRYGELRAGIRRALLRRFPYAVYYAAAGSGSASNAPFPFTWILALPSPPAPSCTSIAAAAWRDRPVRAAGASDEPWTSAIASKATLPTPALDAAQLPPASELIAIP